jgi:ElaB/YqjD/DUF883 family membrane-anchored ribosome-binding protein
MASNGRGSAATVKDIKKDLQSLRDDVSHLAEQISGELTEGGTEALAQARDRIDNIRQSVNEALLEKSHEASNAASDIADAFEETLRNRPLTTLAVVLGLGFVFGASWRK